ncbi:outer membrane protein assembly factor BamB [Kineobactrum sediminis]|uniref:Outer membrane protein assembly factor BamB n=1 Tax=Kineobactrum sediminis TaxID=1905677 RepID=A0A2N5XYW7_9GAMM|nr:outer membrane protein assembly factor BamB [Kineobactrum sediminis]PLW81334.1 outer membrane protein assembly factor BamB [Kineobactrum sediminis]
MGLRIMGKWASLLLLSLVLGGCSTITGWFSIDDDDDPRQPAELQDIDETVDVRKLWSAGVGNGQGEGLYKITPVIGGDTLYAASAEGEVAAFDRRNGKQTWERDLKIALSGGVGLYNNSLFLGASDGYVLRLDARSGEIVWRSGVSGEVLAAPQSNGRVVVVQTYDGKLHGLDFADGKRLWVYDSNMPVLTIRGTSTPILTDNQAIAGFANGRVIAFNAQTGGIEWEARVAIPQGRSEIERMVDIDGSMALSGNDLYAASYQGNIAAIDVPSGRKRWEAPVSSVSGVSLGFGNAYVAAEDGTIYAYLRNGQGQRWSQDVLAWRGLGRPVPVSSYVAVPDQEGFVHILSQVDGSFVARVRPDRKGVRADMLSEGNILYVFGNSGKLIAYELSSKTR